MKYIFPILLFLVMAGQIATAGETPFRIVEESDPQIVTHELRSGQVILGISGTGGGYINRLYLPGIGDVMGEESQRYGQGTAIPLNTRTTGESIPFRFRGRGAELESSPSARTAQQKDASRLQ